MTALMILVVVNTVAWRGNALDPAASTSVGIASVSMFNMAACKVGRRLVLEDAQKHGWEASVTCIETGGKP